MHERLVLHEDSRSGNCYKIKLTAALLGIELKQRQYDILKGETRSHEFLSRINANGRIPVLEIGDGASARFLPESNAACWYLAHGSALIPEDRLQQAEMLSWMFFEQYSHEPNIATLRFWLQFVGRDNLTEPQTAQLAIKRASGGDALAVMDRHLADRTHFVGSALTLADVTLFAYTHVAEEGGFEIDIYPNIQRWIAAVVKTPGFIPMIG